MLTFNDYHDNQDNLNDLSLFKKEVIPIWLFTKEGFFSVIKTDTLQDDKIMVRGRCVGDLQKMLDAIGLNEKIFITPEADYLFRTVIPRKKWIEYLVKTAQDINYSNFKNTACTDDERYHAYSGVWLELKLWQSESKMAIIFRSKTKVK